MRITIELRRPRRRSLVLLIGAILFGVPAAAWASHQFPDVPNGHPFHAEIDAIADAGITAGFPDGGYHPSDPVTRQAMAAFMQRGFGRVGQQASASTITASVGVVAGAASTSNVAVRQLTFTVPGASNAFSPNQFVYLHGRVVFNSSFEAAIDGCPCEFGAQIKDLTSSTYSVASYETFYSPVNNLMRRSVDVVGVFAAPPGPRTYQLETWLSERDVTTNAIQYALGVESSLSGFIAPFGSTGGDTL